MISEIKVATLGGAGGIGGILSVTRPSTLDTYFFHYDGNGNVVNCTDTNRAVASFIEYGPFGTVLAKSGPYEPRHQFSSKENDPSVGLSYYGFRYYSAKLGRWLSRDPVGDDAFLRLRMANLESKEKRTIEMRSRRAAHKPSYFYVDNRPVSEIDPLGLDNPAGGGQNGPTDPTYGCWVDPPERICGTGDSFADRCCRAAVQAVMLVDPGANCQGSATACGVCCGSKLIEDPAFGEDKFSLCTASCELKRVACTGGL